MARLVDIALGATKEEEACKNNGGYRLVLKSSHNAVSIETRSAKIKELQPEKLTGEMHSLDLTAVH